MTLPNISIYAGDRNSIIGSTDARQIASGENWLELYHEKIGERPRADLSNKWKPQLGLKTEGIHAWWHSLQEGVEVSDQYGDNSLVRTDGKAADHHACKIDRLVTTPDGPEILELKHTHARNTLRDAATFYMGQLQWQMNVTGTKRLRFSIIKGNEEPEWGYVDRDDDYIEKLIAQVDAFWWHVTEREAPSPDSPKRARGSAALASAADQIAINGFKPYDMANNNEWASAAFDFIRDKAAAISLKETEKRIRSLIPKDAELVTGHGLTFKRDARGAYRVTIEPSELAYWKFADALKPQGATNADG